MTLRLLVITLTFAIILSGTSRADVKDDLQGIKKEIREKKILLKKTAKVETKVSDELHGIERKLRENETALSAMHRELLGVEASLARTEREIETVKKDVERKKRQIAQRLTTLYKSGELNTARLFFSAASFPEMLENQRYSQSILGNDRKMVAEYNANIEQLRKLKSGLEKEHARKEKIKSKIEEKKHEVEEEKQKKAVYLQKVREDKTRYLASLKELEGNARRLQSMVERLEAKSRKSYSKKSGNKAVVGSGPVLPPVADHGFGSQKGRLSLPAKGQVIARFGRHKHPDFNSFTVSNGIAIAASEGADIRSVYDGQVIFAEYFRGYGNMIIIDHGGGFFSLYAHAGKILKKVGASVARNDVVASFGDVDSPRGPQLYFEIRYQGKPVDPSPWFN
jgi:murein hydrolase activator